MAAISHMAATSAAVPLAQSLFSGSTVVGAQQLKVSGPKFALPARRGIVRAEASDDNPLSTLPKPEEVLKRAESLASSVLPSSSSPTPVDQAAAATNAPPKVRVNPTGAQTSVFSGGRAQEIINGRAAMIGFVSALGAELATGNTIYQQLTVKGGLPLLVVPATFVAILIGSFAPRVKDVKENGLDTEAKSVGPFNQFAETINGRAAMIGFASMLIIEGLKGSAVF